jgi:purine nucleosidase
MGLDVTERARLLPEDLARMAPGTVAPGGPVAVFLDEALRWYFEFHARYDGFYGAFVHDPYVVAAAIDPSLVTTQALAVDVDTAGGAADGMTIADRRGIWGRRPNMDVAVEGDAERFVGRLVERVGGLTRTR